MSERPELELDVLSVYQTLELINPQQLLDETMTCYRNVLIYVPAARINRISDSTTKTRQQTLTSGLKVQQMHESQLHVKYFPLTLNS